MVDGYGLTQREREALMFAPNHPARTGLEKLFNGIQMAEFLTLGTEGLSDGSRHYNAGRASMLVDLESTLEALYAPTSE